MGKKGGTCIRKCLEILLLDCMMGINCLPYWERKIGFSHICKLIDRGGWIMVTCTLSLVRKIKSDQRNRYTLFHDTREPLQIVNGEKRSCNKHKQRGNKHDERACYYYFRLKIFPNDSWPLRSVAKRCQPSSSWPITRMSDM